MHQVKNQPLLKFAWDVQNLIQTIESNNPDPGPMRSVWDTICMAMKQVNEPQVRLAKIKMVTTCDSQVSKFLSNFISPVQKNTFYRRNLFEGELVFDFFRNINYKLLKSFSGSDSLVHHEIKIFCFPLRRPHFMVGLCFVTIHFSFFFYLNIYNFISYFGFYNELNRNT